MARTSQRHARNGASKPSLHQRITDQIIADLEAGTRPWIKPWTSLGTSVRPVRACGTPYRGINTLLLWGEASRRGYTSPTWMTFAQALALGAHVCKGEQGSMVVYANQLQRTEADDTGAETERSIAFLKAYTVFNTQQIEGLPARFDPETTSPTEQESTQAALRFFEYCDMTIHQGGDQAYYAPGSDHIQMPHLSQFRDEESFVATLAHEATHWTKAKHRLDRDFGARSFGDAGYAKEELVAEIGSAFLCADLGLRLEPRPDHAAYLASWLAVLRGDTRFTFSAAAHAQRAVDYLGSLQPPP
jgi:antirestriction protein ArdC